MVSSTPTSQITLDGQPAVLVRTIGWLTLAFLVALFSGLAAVGLGLLLGTVAKSQEQAAH